MRHHSSRTSRFRFALAGALGALAVMGSASNASAHKWYPGWMQEHFNVGCAPQCTLCHTDPNGGQDKVKSIPDSQAGYVDGTDKPSHRGFGVFVLNFHEMVIAGYPSTESAQDRKLFDAKLEALGTQPCQSDPNLGNTTDQGFCDSDGDGTLDILELRAGDDPDVVGAGPECPKYGCGANIGPVREDTGVSSRGVAAIAALGVMLVLARRIRR